MVSLRIFVIKFFIIIVIFFKHITMVNGFGINLIKVPDDNESQVICLMAFLRKYFQSGESLSGSVLYMSLTSASMHTQKKLLESLHGMTDLPWSVVIRDPKNAKSNILSTMVLHEKPQLYFAVIENLEDEDLDDIFEDWKITVNWNPLAQFVVYLCTIEETDEEMTELMIEILLNFMNKKIYNVNVIGQNEETGYYYGKTVFPYHPDNNCGNRVISIETLDICHYHVNEGPENDDYADYKEEEYANSESLESDDSSDMGEREDDDNTDFGDEGDEDGGEIVNDHGNGDDENSKEAKDNGDESSNADDSGDINVENKDFSGNSNHDIGTEEEDNQNTGIVGNDNNDGNDYEYDNNGDATDGVKTNTDNSGDGININNNDVVIKNDDNDYNDNRSNNGENSVAQDDVMTYSDSKNEDDGNGEGVNNTNDSKSSNDNGTIEESDTEISEVDTQMFPKDDHGMIQYIWELEMKNINKPEKKTEKTYNRDLTIQNLIPPRQTHPEPFINNDNLVYDINKREKCTLSPRPMHLESEPVTEESDSDTSNGTTNKSTFYFEEVFRALFLDKFPKHLSGCLLAAAYRPWEPYIFEDPEESVPEYLDINNTESNSSFQSDSDYGSEFILSEDYDIKKNTFGDYDSETIISNEDTNEKILNGIEYKLLQTIGERLHISIDLQVENRNLYHLFQQLIDGEIEMVVGGIDEDPIMSQYVSTTIPYHQDDLTFCVKRARRSHNLFNFLASFSWVVWIITIIYIVVISLTITWIPRQLKVRLKYSNSFFFIMFRVFGIIFSQSMPLANVAKPLRYIFYTAFFMALIFANAYQSFLISTLTTPKSAYQISRVEEIYKNRMIIKGSVENVRHLNKEGEIFKYIREKFQMCYNIEECLIEAAESEKIAVAVSRQHSFYNPRIPRSRLYCFDRNENLYIYLVTMLLPKNFHLLHKINPVVQYVIESGHMQKWARDLDMRRRIQEERNHAHEDKIRSLTLGQVFGSFVLTGALLGIALLAFILENYVYRLATKRRRSRLKIVKYLHRKFQHQPIKHY